MHILKERPLATILIVWLGGFLLFGMAPVWLRSALLAALVCVFVLLFTCFATARGRRFALLLSVVCALAFLCSALYFDCRFFVADRFEKDTPVQLEGYITQITYDDGLYTTAYMKVESINGEAFTSSTLLLTSETGELSFVSPGDRVRVQAVLQTLENTGNESHLSLIGQGVCAEATVTDCTYTDQSSEHALTAWRHKTTEAFTRRASAVLGEEGGALLSALILGERSMLSPAVEQDFFRIGISHLLALSGLHLSILSLLAMALLSLIGLRKTTRYAVLCVLVAVYVVLTGAPDSILRAGGMLIFSSLLFLGRHTRDPITTLCTVVAVICLISPYSLYSLSLWLSALATLGILLFSLWEKDSTDAPLPLYKRPLRLFVQSILLSVSAQGAALLLSVLSFGTLSVVSPISTFVFGFLMQLFIYIGLAAMLLGGLIPFIGQIASALALMMQKLADAWASDKFVLADAAFDEVQILAVVFTVLLVLFVVCPVKHKRSALCLLSVLFISVYVCAFVKTYQIRTANTHIYFSDETKEGLILTGNDSTVAIDIGTGGADFGSITAHRLTESHIRYLDAYILTRYSPYLSSALRQVLQNVPCRCVYLPAPSNEKEEDIMSTVIQCLALYDTAYDIYSPVEGVAMNGFSVAMPYRAASDSRTDFFMTVKTQQTSILYLSRGSLSDKTQAAAYRLTASCDTVILGCCGYNSNTIIDLPLADTVKTCIIADKKITIRKDRYEQYLEKTQVVLYPRWYTIR